MGKEFVAGIHDTIEKGLIWKRLMEESVKEESKEEKYQKRKRHEEKKQKEKEEKLPVEMRQLTEAHPTPLTQEVYTQGVKNWAAQASLERFFGPPGRGNCDGIAADSILHSGTCRDDPSLHIETHLNEFLEDTSAEEAKISNRKTEGEIMRTTSQRIPSLPRLVQSAIQTRAYHTTNYMKNENRKTPSPNPQKMLMPIRQAKSSLELLVRNKPRKLPPLQSRLRNNQYKNLKVAAKQKYRSFNVQKKFTPSASVLLLMDKKKKERADKNLEIVTAEPQVERPDEEKKEDDKKEEEEDEEGEGKPEEGKEGEGKPEEGKEGDKQLIVQKEKDKYKDFIFRQLRDLKRENEELKKKLTKLCEDKQFEATLQNQSDNLELERTKLKACWLIMSSTMDAFSNFCKKFTCKSEEQLLDAAKELTREAEEDEEFDDALENVEEDEEEEEKTKHKVKKTKYDERYFKFLQKLMEDQMENELEEKRNRVRK